MSPQQTVEDALRAIQSTSSDLIAAVRIAGGADLDFSPTAYGVALCAAINRIVAELEDPDTTLSPGTLPWHPGTHPSVARLARYGTDAFTAGDFATTIFVSGALCLLVGREP